MSDTGKLKSLEEKLAKYREILAVKKREFRGVRHEDSLSELRYTQYRVYQDLVGSLETEITALKRKK